MFKTPCDIQVLPSGEVQLINPLVFSHRGVEITLIPGFTWNLASIPSGIRDIMGCPFDYVYESALHDALYGTGLFPRDISDLYWYIALRSGGEFKQSVAKVKAKALYAGVRIGGAPFYKSGSISAAREFVSIIYLDRQ